MSPAARALNHGQPRIDEPVVGSEPRVAPGRPSHLRPFHRRSPCQHAHADGDSLQRWNPGTDPSRHSQKIRHTRSSFRLESVPVVSCHSIPPPATMETVGILPRQACRVKAPSVSAAQ